MARKLFGAKLHPSIKPPRNSSAKEFQRVFYEQAIAQVSIAFLIHPREIGDYTRRRLRRVIGAIVREARS